MRTKIYRIVFLILIILIQGTAGQTQFKKRAKILPPATQNKLATKLQNNFNDVAKKIQELIRQKGIIAFQNNSSAINSSTAVRSSFRIAAPSLNRSIYNEKVIYDKNSGLPIFIRVTSPLAKSSGIINASDFIKNSQAFLFKEKELLKIEDPESEFELKKEFKDNLGITHLRFAQKYKGLEVWGKEIILHMDNNGNVISLTGRYATTPSVISNINGNISAEEAISISLKNSGISTAKVSKLYKELTGYDEPIVKKIIWCDEYLFPHLAWFVELRKGLSQDWYYFIDANEGTVLNHYNNVCYDGAATGTGTDLNSVNRTFGTYQIGNDYYMIDTSLPMYDAANSQLPDNTKGALVLLSLNGKDLSSENPVYYFTSSSNTWSDPASISAQYNAITTYRYYSDVLKRNSVDDKGMTIYSIMHVTENNQPMDNAFWTGKVMCYGDGGTAFKSLAGGLDVGAHEMTHGVTQYSANLEYQGQSGALNESMSDVFGVMVDDNNWTVGEDIIKDFNSFPTGALRDMSNPHNGGTQGSPSWQPANMSEFVNTTGDNGGVHINSGIPNHVFYLAATSLGRSTAAQIWYRALTVYLTRSSQFIDARIATINAATDLFGASSNEVAGVKSAWDAVGVTDGTGTTQPPPSYINGDNWILMTNTASNDPNSIYMAKPTISSDNDIFPLSATPVLNKPAVSDGSGLIIFVDQQNNLRALVADPNNPSEEVLESSGIWWSVAIGPGLSSLAFTSIYIDTTVYYYDLVNNVSKSFKIVTQSYDAPDAKTALYADALSFDPTGQYLLFDSYNEIKNANGDTLSFWTINILDIISGDMGSVFPPLQEGIDVGNPSYSKTSSTHFTFDYFDENSGQDQVMAADFNTGNVGVIVGPLDVVGFPTYSGDDKSIAFHTTASSQGTLHHAINQIGLKDNMIEGTGTPQDYVIDATFPYWFVIGTRTTDVNEEHNKIPASFFLSQNYPNPFNPSTTISYQLPVNSKVKLEIFNLLGQKIETLVDEFQNAGFHSELFTLNSILPSGIYFYQLNTGNFVETKKMILMK